MGQSELRPHAVLALPQGGHPAPHRGHRLTQRQGEALHARRLDLPAVGLQPLLDCCNRAAHHAMAHPDPTSPASGLEPLGLEQPGQGHPPGLGRRAWGLPAFGLSPVPIGRQQGRRVRAQAIGEQE
jgi:hypothetical protein